MTTILDTVDGEKSQVMEILHNNKDKNFVKRILNPGQYPEIDNGDGSRSTHLMAWSDAPNGKFRVYPTITHDEETNTLRKLDANAAYDTATQKGDYIDFDTASQAEWFAQRYKAAWEGQAEQAAPAEATVE